MAKPIITTQPVSQIALQKTSPTLSVVATGAISYQWLKNGFIIAGAVGPNLTFTTCTEMDTGVYHVRVSNMDGFVDSDVATFTVATTILDRIELEIQKLIAGIVTASGYNFNWSIINEEDEAIGNFPRALIDPRDSVADRETCADTVAGVGSLDYTNEILFTILVRGIMPTFNNNAVFNVRSTLRKGLDDLKKLFGIYNQLEGACDNIMYVSSQIEPIRTNEILSPGQLRVIFKVIYAQDRQNPLQYASS